MYVDVTCLLPFELWVDVNNLALAAAGQSAASSRNVRAGHGLPSCRPQSLLCPTHHDIGALLGNCLPPKMYLIISTFYNYVYILFDFVYVILTAVDLSYTIAI